MGAWEVQADPSKPGNRLMRQVSPVWPACWGYSCTGAARQTDDLLLFVFRTFSLCILFCPFPERFRSLLSVCRADDLLRTQAFQRLRSSWLQNLPRRACLPTPCPLSPLCSSSTFSSSDIRMPPGSPPPLPSALSSSLSF